MIRLKNKQVLIQPIFDSDYYNSQTQLIKIPEYAKERSDQGIIKYMGEDVDPSIKIGDHVIFSGYTGTTIGVDDELLILLHSDFIKATLDDIEAYEVPGLYLRGKIDGKKVKEDILAILGDNSASRVMAPLLVLIGNLLFESRIPATYESSLPLIAKAYKDFYGSRVTVKANDTKESRDPYDSRRK